MRHTIVTRVSVALFGVFLLTAVLFGWLRSRPRPSESTAVAPASAIATTTARATSSDMSGEALFGQRCGACHTAADVAAALNRGGDRAARRREVEMFLRDHAEATAREDQLILNSLTR